MPRRPSIQSIADMLGLSKFAVSRALSGKSGVSERRAAARAVGYRLPDVVGADAIGNANADGARLLVQHLFRQGRRSFLFVGCDAFARSFRDRWIGCRLAVEDLGGAARLRRWTVPYREHRWTDRLALQLNELAPDDRPDAFVCANDHIALVLLQRLHQIGVRVPDDAALVGFDNIRDAALAEPPLTTVELAKEALGHRAVEQLARRLERPGALPETISLAPRLVARGSG